VRLGHRGDVKAPRGPLAAGSRVYLVQAPHRVRHRTLVVDHEPVSPSTTSSGAEPSVKAMTGVPQAIASVMTRPNGSAQRIGIEQGGGTTCSMPPYAGGGTGIHGGARMAILIPDRGSWYPPAALGKAV
jgi:hypothetical protein